MSKKMCVGRLILFVSTICFGCGAMPPKHQQTFQEAQSAFDRGDYRQSVALYEQLLAQGVRSGAIYYNLGNALAKVDEPVRAIAAYYLAKRYIPNDLHLNSNLNAVLLNNGGAQSPPDSSLVCYIFFWQNWVGFQTKLWGSLTLAALTVCVGVFSQFRPSQQSRRCLIGIAVLAAIATASTGYDWYRFEGVEQVVVEPNALPRKGNSEEYEQAFVTPTPFGILAVVLEERSGWYLLRFPNSQEGWLACSQTVLLR